MSDSVCETPSRAIARHSALIAVRFRSVCVDFECCITARVCDVFKKNLFSVVSLHCAPATRVGVVRAAHTFAQHNTTHVIIYVYTMSVRVCATFRTCFGRIASHDESQVQIGWEARVKPVLDFSRRARVHTQLKWHARIFAIASPESASVWKSTKCIYPVVGFPFARGHDL